MRAGSAATGGSGAVEVGGQAVEQGDAFVEAALLLRGQGLCDRRVEGAGAAAAFGGEAGAAGGGHVHQELAAVGGKLQLDLTPENVAVAGATLKRTQLYSFHDMPLAQISYLSPSEGPLAFCVIVNGKPDHDPAFEVREGFNIVYWNKDGRGFLVIGRAPRDDLERLAGTLRTRLS